MLSSDIAQLTEQERELLANSFHLNKMQRRTRGVILGALAVVLGVVALDQLGLTIHWFEALTLVVVAISTTEKFTYHRAMTTYEGLIRKLAHRVEELEGLQLTPNNADPAVERGSARKVG
jgi:hypothetical protein